MDIVRENVNAVQAIYVAYQLEQMQMFQVVERIVELCRQGLLPLGTGSVAEVVRRQAAADRITAQERGLIYGRTLGVPGGADDDVEPNREFASLWLRFLVSVALYARQHDVETLLAPPAPANARVRDAAHELAANASAFGGGSTPAVAQRLSAEVRASLALLGDPQIERAFGARDLWQVVDQVNRNELGGAVNVARYRMWAQAGSVALEWLAAHAALICDRAGRATDASPDNAALVQAVEQWLAVSGLQESQVDAFAQPKEAPTISALPIDLPAVAHELLDAIGAADRPSNGDDAIPRSVVALFHGPSGTGKTLAAHVLAEALSRPIHRIDLARVVGKYIGETEKNLAPLFARARETDAILFFDEADALFGKRSEVKDAHDRYANAEVGYLLQRIDAYDGIVVLACNESPQIDDAFADDRWRRKLVRIPFPRPRR